MKISIDEILNCACNDLNNNCGCNNENDNNNNMGKKELLKRISEEAMRTPRSYLQIISVDNSS